MRFGCRVLCCAVLSFCCYDSTHIHFHLRALFDGIIMMCSHASCHTVAVRHCAQLIWDLQAPLQIPVAVQKRTDSFMTTQRISSRQSFSVAQHGDIMTRDKQQYTAIAMLTAERRTIGQASSRSRL